MVGEERDIFTIAWRFLAWAMVATGIASTAHAESRASYQALKEHSAFADKGISKLNLNACRQISGFMLKSSGILRSPIVWSKLSIPATDNQIVFTSTNIVIAEDYTPLIVFTRYVVMPDDTVVVTMQTILPKTFDLVMNIKTFRCKLGDGISVSF